ncbi:rNA-binding protein Jag [Clostridium sp. CAG:1219]|nr:rNA-binding protein Jag [Clostridium sp. CAG:1219]
MKKSSEQYGKTVEEAIRKGLEELKVSRDDVKVEILEEPSNGGILGMISAKMAKVRVTVDKKISDSVAEKTIEKVEKILKEIFDITGESSISYSVNRSENQIIVNIKGDNVSHLIGYKGKTIESIQSVLNSILQKEDEEYAKVFLEINDYKKQKEEKLRRLANKMAENVIRFRKPIKLEPMSAYERLIIHSELANRDDVETESFGEEPRRRVVIRKKY